MSDTQLPPLSALLVSQRERWQRGDCVRVEKLLEELPTLDGQDGPILELLYHEMLLSEERGEQPQLDDYLRRFPQFASQVRMQFEVHAALTAAGGLSPTGDQAGGERMTGGNSRRPEIAGYEILAEVGRGGMGIVYKARQIKLNRIVALKMIRSGLLAGQQELARFHREAEVVAQLQHPNIVQIHEVGEASGWPYLALEFVDGTSLDRTLAGKLQPVEFSARLIETLARAMHYAHLRGVVHRDLKPANVLLGSGESGKGSSVKNQASALAAQETVKRSSFLTPDSTPLMPLAKITDFGLAKSLEPGTEGPTHTGDILGTPSYMAPEQAGGRPGEVNAAADIYSLGAILYEMLAGRPPFLAETMLETLLQVRTQEPASPSRLRSNLPRDLVTICLTCLHKQPGRRYSSAAELADDLRRFLQHEPIRARPTGIIERGVKWTRRRPAVATLIATMLLVAVFGFAFVSWQLGKTAAALADAQRAHAATRDQNYLNLVALAHHELLAHHVDQAQRLLEECPPIQRGWEWHYLQRLCQTDLLTISAHPSEARALAYSSDGKLIVSGSGNWYGGDTSGEVKVWDAQTGKELHTLERGVPTIFAVAFSPDDRLLAGGGRAGKVALWNPHTGERIRELVLDRGSINDLAFSPDGSRLASVGTDLRIWDVATGACLHVFKQHRNTVWSVAWSPDSRRIISTDWNGEAHLWDAEAGRHLRLLIDAVDLRVSAFSPDGSQLALGSWDGSIQIWKTSDLDAPPAILNPNLGQLYGLAYDPDGRRLAFCARDGFKILDIRTGAELHSFAGHNGVAVTLVFSPDGSRLVTGGMDGTLKVWDATVREEFRRSVEANATIRGFSFDASGRHLALGSSNRAVKAWDVATGKAVLSIANQSTPVTAVAGDSAGRWLAWLGSDSCLNFWDVADSKLLWTVPIEQGPATGLAFSASGKHLALGGADGVVHIFDTATGKLIDKLGEAGSPLSGVAYDPHGRLLATIDQRGTYRIWDVAARAMVARFGGSRRDLPAAGSADDLDPQGGTAPRVTRLGFSPDGKRLASAARLRPPEIWDATTGNLALILDRSVDGADCATFSADGRQLIVGIGGQMRFWNTAELPRAERLRQALASRTERNWHSRALHLNALIAAEPNSAAHREQRAYARAQLARWEEALADNDKAIELGSKSVNVWYSRVTLALRSGDLDGYRQTCAAIQEKFEVSDEPELANFLAWVSVVSPAAGGDPLRSVALAEQAVQKNPGNYSYLNTRGAALYRAGRHQEALEQLQAAIRAEPQKQGTGIDWAFLAMAYARLGNSEQARQWLDKARAAPEPTQWHQRIELVLLVREGAEVINSHPIAPENDQASPN